MKRLTIIHNGGAGSQDEDELALVGERLGAVFSVDVLVVGEGDDPSALARRARDAGAEVLVASGGDGTVSAVAGVLVGDEGAALGIVPRGTGNSIATSLGVPEALEEACDTILAGHVRTIDTARVFDAPMVLMACVGLHAETITETASETKQRFGKLAYVAKGLALATSAAPFEVRFDTEDASVRCEVSALTIANLAPPTTFLAQGAGELCPDDGLLDVTLVSVTGIAETLATSAHLVTRALAGLPADRENVASLRARRIAVHTDEPMTVMVDGEDAGTTPFEVECVPASLRVLVPRPETSAEGAPLATTEPLGSSRRASE